MATTLINYVVDKYLSNILEIDKEKTQTSLFSGILNMENLKIKSSLFDSINIPYFEIVHGFVGQIKVEFSPLTIWKNPIKVKVSKVFFMVRQKHVSKLNEEAEVQKLEDFKNSKLQSVEELRTQIDGVASEPGMIEQIINNVQIEISEVVFRFEDTISNPRKPFIFGLTLNKMFIRSTNYLFDETIDQVKVETVNYKVIKIDGLYMYMDYSDNIEDIDFKKKIVDEERENAGKMESYLKNDFEFYLYCMSDLNYHRLNTNSHNYILYNLVMKLCTSLNQDPKENFLPKLEPTLNIDSIQLSINLEQIKILFKLLAYINLNSLYLVGLYNDYYNKQPTKYEKKAYLDVYIEYFKRQYDKKYLDKKKAKEILENQVRPLEKQLTYEQISSMREAAFMKFTYTSQLELIDDEIMRLKGRWKVTSLFTSGSDQKALDDLEKRRAELKEKEEENIQQIQDQLEKVGHSDNSIENPYKDLPQDWVMMKANFNLDKFSLDLSENANKRLVEFSIEKFIIKAELGTDFQNATLKIGSIDLNQYKVENNTFSKILQSYSDHLPSNSADLSSNEDQLYEKYQDQAFYIEFQKNPRFEKSDMKLLIRNDKRLFLYGNLYTLSFLGNRISSALKGDIDFDEMKKMAGNEAAKYMSEGKQAASQILEGNYDHKNVDIDLMLKGPVVVLPQNVLNYNNTSCITLSMGMFLMNSKLADRKSHEIDYIRLNNVNKLYDCYLLNLKGLECYTLTDYVDPQSVFKSKTKLDMIKNINVEIKLANSIEPKNLYNENLVIDLTLNSIQTIIADKHLLFIVEYLNFMDKNTKQLVRELDIIEQKDKEIQAKDKEAEKDMYNNNLTYKENQDKKDIKDNKVSLSEQAKEQFKRQEEENKEKHIKEKEQFCNSKATKKSYKDIISFTFKLNKLDFSLCRSTTKQEIALFEENEINYEDKMLKPFINFVCNGFFLEVKLNEIFDANVDLRLKNLFLFDRDFNYRISDDQRLQSEMALNPEFSCIVGSINEQQESVDAEKSNSRSISMYSEAYNLDDCEEDSAQKTGSNSNKRSVDFIIIKVKFLSKRNKTSVDINFTKLLVSMNLNTIERLALFFKAVTDFQFEINNKNSLKSFNTKRTFGDLIHEERSTSMTNKDQLDIDLNNIDMEKIAEAQVSGEKPKKKKFFKKVLEKTKARKEQNELAEQNKEQSDPNNANNKKDEFFVEGQINTNMLRIEEEDNKVDELKQAHRKENSKSTLEVSFVMKDIELNYPLVANHSDTKVMTMNINMIVKMKKKVDCEYIYNILGDLIRTNYRVNNMDLNLMINNFELDIESFINNQLLKNKLNDKLLLNTRILAHMKQFILHEKETNVSNMELTLEPLFIICGFKQLQTLNQFSSEALKFLGKLSSGELTTIANHKKEDEFKTELIKTIEEMEAKRKYIEMYNIASYNNLSDMTVKMEKCVIQLIDNRLIYENPLFKVDISKINVKMLSNSDPGDTDNAGKALVEIIASSVDGLSHLGTKYQHTYNIINLFKYLDTFMSMEISYFNERLNSWEPILEPWSVNISQLQVLKSTKSRIDIFSDQIINFNVSVNSISDLNSLMKAYYENYFFTPIPNLDEDIKSCSKKFMKQDTMINSNNNNSSLKLSTENNSECRLVNNVFDLNNIEAYQSLVKNINLSKEGKLKTKQKTHNPSNDISFEVLNNLGIACSFFISAEPEKEYCLKSNDKLPFTKNKMMEIYRHLNDEESILLKDKLTLKLLDHDIEIDFSYNRYQIISFKTSNSTSSSSSNIELLITTQNNGIIKQVIFSSNVSFYNNSSYSINLAFLESKLTSNEDNHDMISFEKANIINLKEKETYNIPLNYLLTPHMVFSEIGADSLLNHESSGYKLLYPEIDFVQNYSQDAKTLNKSKLNSKYSNIVDYDLNENKTHLSFDLLVWGSNEEDEELQEDENDTQSELNKQQQLKKVKTKVQTKVNTKNSNIPSYNDNKDIDNKLNQSIVLKKGNNLNKVNTIEGEINKDVLENANGYTIVINPPYQLENLLPYNIKFDFSENSKKVEDGNINKKVDSDVDSHRELNFNKESETLLATKFNIEPLNKRNIYLLDYNENRSDLAISMDYTLSRVFENKSFSFLNNLDSKTSTIKLKLDQINDRESDNTSAQSDSLTIVVKLEEIEMVSEILNLSFCDKRNLCTKALKAVFYTDFLIVNRLPYNIYMKPNKCKIKDEEITINKAGLCFNSKEISIYSMFSEEEKKALIKNNDSNWSKPFDITTHGVTGVVTLNCVDKSNIEDKTKKNIKEKIYNQEISTVITSSSYFANSTIIVFEPRFVIVNDLPFDVYLKQDFEEDSSKNNKDSEVNEVELIKIKKKEENIISIRDNKRNKKIFSFGNTRLVEDFSNISEVDNDDNKDSEILVKQSNKQLKLSNYQIKKLFSPKIDLENIDDFTFGLLVPDIDNIIDKDNLSQDIYEVNFEENIEFKMKNSKKIGKGDNSEFYISKFKHILVRAIVQTKDNGLLYIVLTLPKFPQFTIDNKTSYQLQLAHKESNNNLSDSIITVKNNSNTVFCWSKFLETKFEVEIEFVNPDELVDKQLLENPILKKQTKDRSLLNFSFEKLEKNFVYNLKDGSNRKLILNLELINHSSTRVLKITEQNENTKDSIGNRDFFKKAVGTVFNLNVHFEGFGISLIDATPKELFFISFYSFDCRITDITMRRKDVIEKVQNIELYIKNFQIDYCLKSQFLLLLSPKKQNLPENSVVKIKTDDDEELVPFIQALITKKSTIEMRTSNEAVKFTQLDFTMQEMELKLDQIALNSLLQLVSSVTGILDFNKVNNLNSNINAENNTNTNDKNMNEDPYFMAKQNILISKKEKFNSHHDSNNSNDILYNKLILICPELSVDYQLGEELLSEFSEQSSNMMFIEALMLSAIKVSLTLRIDISTLKMGLIPKFVIKILGTVGNSLMRITDSPLKFSELILQECFTNSGKLVGLLIAHYAKQGVKQFYKIIGSSDLIGNPVGLVDKVGTGFIEFFNEPRKGFLQGPDKFGKGLAKGINSLVSGIVGGSFDTIGKISGTLLYASKNIVDDKNEPMNEDEPDNVVSGAYRGVTGGVKEIGKGLIGIFTNPYKSAKKEGVKGFFKGVGKGLLGAVVSPFSAAFTVVNSVSVGMKNTANMFTAGKLKTLRFRHPRHISKNLPLSSYDAGYAEVQQIIKCFKSLNTQKLVFFHDFKFIDEDLQEGISTIIITDKQVAIVYNAKEMVLQMNLNNLKNTEVHSTSNKKVFLVVFYLIRNQKCLIATENLKMCTQVHYLLQNMIEKRLNRINRKKIIQADGSFKEVDLRQERKQVAISSDNNDSNKGKGKNEVSSINNNEVIEMNKRVKFGSEDTSNSGFNK